MTDAEKIEVLTLALELAAGALSAAKLPDANVVTFGGEWERLGRWTIGAILDKTSETLGRVKGKL